MAAWKLREPLREFDPSTSRELLPLGSCRLAFLGLQNCLPKNVHKKRVLSLGNTQGSIPSTEDFSCFRFIRKRWGRLSRLERGSELPGIPQGPGNPRNSTAITHSNPCMLQRGRYRQRMGTCPRPQSHHTGGSPEVLRYIIFFLLLLFT